MPSEGIRSAYELEEDVAVGCLPHPHFPFSQYNPTITA